MIISDLVDRGAMYLTFDRWEQLCRALVMRKVGEINARIDCAPKAEDSAPPVKVDTAEDGQPTWDTAQVAHRTTSDHDVLGDGDRLGDAGLGSELESRHGVGYSSSWLGVRLCALGQRSGFGRWTGQIVGEARCREARGASGMD